ncbi:MAG: restriction endonuclease subunit S [Verrucomicrobia bacterium]|nr:restriction endonuclease subunit S [Verrucomicrobiota bacterium]
MKKGWQTKKLGDVCDFEGGSQPPKSEFIYDEKPGYVRFLQIRDFGSDKNITYIRRSKKNRLCDENDILIGRYGASVGKILTGKAGSYNVALMKTLPNLEVLDQSWFYHFLISDEFQKPLLNVADRSAQAGFSKDDIYNFPVPVPPLAEQQRIVGLLDEAFEGLATAKANAEKNLQNARALFESHLQSVFTQRGPGWVEKPFEDCIEDVKYTTKIQRKEFLEEGDFPIVSQEAEFTNGYWDNAADVFKVSRPVVIFGDHTQVLKYIDFDFVLGADGVKLLPPKPFLNPKFFFYALRSAPLKSLGYARHYRLLKELQIGYPDTNAQVAIAKKLDALEAETQRLARLYERKHAALEALKKSLLHQAFTGAL